jgi:hypothetical protein
MCEQPRHYFNNDKNQRDDEREDQSLDGGTDQNGALVVFAGHKINDGPIITQRSKIFWILSGSMDKQPDVH